MKSVLLISNRKMDESGGRPEKFRTRRRILSKHGWKIHIGYIPCPFDFRSIKSMNAIKQCIQRAREDDIDIINSINEPPQLHIIGYLASKLCNKPWLMEFRDPYATNPYVDENSINGRCRKVLESFLVQRADRIIWNNGIQLSNDYFHNRYPDVQDDRWTMLPYIGYEQNRFQLATKKKFDKFTITYAGSFYEDWIEPYPFIQALSIFREKYPNADIDFRIYGDWNSDYKEAAKVAGVSDVISTYGWINYEELIPILKGSDVLLYLGGVDPANRLNIPSKIYDYVGAKTPILAVTDPSFRAGEFVRQNQLGIVSSYEEPTTVADALEKLYNRSIDFDSSYSYQYSRQKNIEALVGVLNEMFDNR